MALKIRGYASIFRNVDQVGEIVDPGAFSDWIAENPTKSLPIFWAHDHIWDPAARPIGKTTKLRQDSKGLYYEAELADTAKAEEIQQLIKNGAATDASFAFRVNDQYQLDEVWHLSSLDPTEITVCTWGANPEAYTETIPEGDEG